MSLIVRSGSRQYVVEKGQKIVVNNIKGVQPGDVVELDVLAVFGGDADTKKVKATVVAHQKGEKIRVVKYKSKSNYHRQYGPRQLETVLEIASTTKKKAPAKKKTEVKKTSKAEAKK